jgi:ribose transport system substrate-binding protein
MSSLRSIKPKISPASLYGLLALTFNPFFYVAAGVAQGGPAGITTPIVLPPFNADAPACAAPPGLRKALVFAQDNERQFMQGVGQGLAKAAKNRGLEYHVALANNDPRKMIDQVLLAQASQAGAVVAAPVDPPSLSSSLQSFIFAGGYVGTVVPPPATSLRDAAAAYIKEKLQGQAKVVLLTHDSLQFLAPRFVAMRDSLKDIPGITIVADISPLTVDKAGGATMMRTILLADPDIDVVLGADTVVLGALSALREAGKARPNQFLGGIDGEPEAVAEIKSGGPYKTSVSLASPVFGYAMGQHAADWLEGKSIPQAMDILPKLLTSANMASYEADLADPAAVYRDLARRAGYLKMYGNICYDTRDRYINFPWSSEAN